MLDQAAGLHGCGTPSRQSALAGVTGQWLRVPASRMVAIRRAAGFGTAVRYRWKDGGLGAVGDVVEAVGEGCCAGPRRAWSPWA